MEDGYQMSKCLEKNKLKVFLKRDIEEQFKQWIYDFYYENIDYDEVQNLFHEYGTEILSDFKYMNTIITELTAENFEIKKKLSKQQLEELNTSRNKQDELDAEVNSLKKTFRGK